MNQFNICPSCMHCSTCVLTAQKDKVWSCSEFDEIKTTEIIVETIERPKRSLELV